MATTASSESRKKFVCVGDEACGKTSLLKTFCGTAFSEAYIPTVSESYTTQQTTPIYDDQGGEATMMTTIEFVDTTGSEELDRLRPLSYDGADLWIVCFSVEKRQSLINVIEKWVPEVKYFAPTIPLILVGCKVDLREDPDAVDRLARSGDVPVAIEEAQDVAREIGAFKYVETSAKLGFQIQNLFDDEVDDSGEYVEDEEAIAEEEGDEENEMGDIVEEEEEEETDSIINNDQQVIPEIESIVPITVSHDHEDEDYITAHSSSHTLSDSASPPLLSKDPSSATTTSSTLSSTSSTRAPSPLFSHTHRPTKQQHHRISRMPAPRISLEEHPALPTHAPVVRKIVVTATGVVVDGSVKRGVRRTSTASSLSSSSSSGVESLVESMRSGLPAGGGVSLYDEEKGEDEKDEVKGEYENLEVMKTKDEKDEVEKESVIERRSEAAEVEEDIIENVDEPLTVEVPELATSINSEEPALPSPPPELPTPPHEEPTLPTPPAKPSLPEFLISSEVPPQSDTSLPSDAPIPSEAPLPTPSPAVDVIVTKRVEPKVYDEKPMVSRVEVVDAVVGRQEGGKKAAPARRRETEEAGCKCTIL